MKGLYEKNELIFALVWIGIYCVLQSLANPLNDILGVKNAASAAFCAVQAVVLFSFLQKNRLLEKYGLCKPSGSARQFLYYVPLVILATGNLWNGIRMNYAWLEMICHIILMLCVGFAEEVIFRGFLFKAMARDNLKTAMIISSVTFGAGHLVNLVNGSGMELAANLFQIAGAIAFGFLFVLVFYCSKSLIPCIAVHSMINILSAFGNQTSLTMEKRMIFTLMEFAIIFVYARILIKTALKNQADR